MRKEIGTPSTHLINYETLSPFNKATIGEGNEKYLKNVAVRVYHDLDVDWYLKNRRRSIYDCNFLATSELINRLLLMGNDRAAFIAGKKGYRSNGMRHPHSWSIIDEPDFVAWINGLIP